MAGAGKYLLMPGFFTDYVKGVTLPIDRHQLQGLRIESSGCACAGSDVPLVVKLFCMAHIWTAGQSLLAEAAASNISSGPC